jgi:hypothetical protein
MSSLLSNKKALSTNKYLYENKDLWLIPDLWKLKVSKSISPLIGLLGEIVTIPELSTVLILDYTFNNAQDEYVTALGLMPLHLFFPNEIKNMLYFINEAPQKLGFGVVLNVPKPENINYYDHFNYFFVDENKIIPTKINPCFKKTLFKIDPTGKKDGPYSCLMVGLTRNVSINDTLLDNLNKTYPFLKYEDLVSEASNVCNLDNKIHPGVVNMSPIDDYLVMNAINILRYLSLEEYIEYWKEIFDFIFKRIYELSMMEISNQITNDPEIINEKSNLITNLKRNPMSNIYLILTHDKITKTYIKCILRSNQYNNSKIDDSDYIIFNKNVSFNDLLSTDVFMEIFQRTQNEVMDQIKDIVTKIYEEFN